MKTNKKINKYRLTKKGKLAYKRADIRYKNTSRGKIKSLEASQRYKKTPKGKLAKLKDEKSFKGKMRFKRYQNSPTGIATYLKNIPKNRESYYKKLYRMSLKDYEDLLNKQNHTCAICRQKETILLKKEKVPRRLAVDHCHKTSKVRGLLCKNCNVALGQFKDSETILLNAINYLKNANN